MMTNFDESGTSILANARDGCSQSPEAKWAGDSDAAAAGRLDEVDWSFAKRSSVPKIEGIHPYPAKFIGAIPAAFLANLPVPRGTAVLDPFCGSGTTLLEAQRLGLPSIGVDLNPIACLISRVKTSPMPSGFLKAVACAAKEAQSMSDVEIPPIPNIDHWFKKDIQAAISSLSQIITSPRYSLWTDQMRLALSSILVRVSNQDSDTRYAAVSKHVDRSDVFSAFETAAKKLSEALASRDWHLEPSDVIEANVLELEPGQISKPVGMVITSPPYPNAYEYWLYHKYRMWWLGFDPLAVKEMEIGARAHFFKKNHHTAELFEYQMSRTLTLLDRTMVPGGYVCVVVGRSKIHGAVIDNGSMLYDLGQRLGFAPVTKLERQMNSNRKSFNLSHANIKTESVLVLQKQ